MEGGNIRMVNPRVGADESETMLDDDRPDAHAQDFVALLQQEFHDTRIFFGLPRQFQRSSAWRDSGEIHHPPFGFADDLRCDNEDVAIFQG
jgi:hypothetical protein